jgi:hypothetical protein
MRIQLRRKSLYQQEAVATTKSLRGVSVGIAAFVFDENKINAVHIQ